MESRRTRDVEALSLLCRELARLGLLVEIRDAHPAVSARTGATDSKIWVTVNPSGQLFTWHCEDADRHPVEDPEGAAAHIFDHLKIREYDSNKSEGNPSGQMETDV